MASLDQIAIVFNDIKYNEAEGFEGVEGAPCLGCVSHIDLDVRCVCADTGYNDTCILCHHKGKICGSIPPGLLGAAQWYWNFVVSRSRRDPKLGVRPGHSPALTGHQLWQIRYVLKCCGPAWRQLEIHLMDKNNLKILAIQESIANREILTLSLLQSAGLIGSHEELQQRIEAAQPPHARPNGAVRTLRQKFYLLFGSASLKVPPGKEHEFDSLPRNFPQTVISRFPAPQPTVRAPLCSVVHSGGMPVLDGRE